jgi:hypothetical protein
MANADRLNNLLKRAVRTRGRIIWAADVRARRATDQDTYLVIGGPAPVSVGGAIVETRVPGSPPTSTP